MFYSNNMADPSKGARKKIHGGSSISDNGDAYGPGSQLFICQLCIDDQVLTTGFFFSFFFTGAAFFEFHQVCVWS